MKLIPMPANSHSADKDWIVSFEAVRLHQMREFRSWSLQRKIQAMEDMAELVAHFQRLKQQRDGNESNSR